MERILDGQPTLFQLDSTRVFMFLGPTNVRIYSRQERLNPRSYPGAWALVDSGSELIRPREELTTGKSKFFVIQASSPQPSRWKEWSKQLNAPLAVMKAWTWEELYIEGSVDTFLGSHMLTELHRTTFETPPIEGSVLREVFTKYGPSARHCYELARSEKSRNTWEAVIPERLLEIPRIDTLIRRFSRGYVDANSEAILKASSQLFTINPNNDREPQVTLASKHISSHLYNVITQEGTRKFWLCFNQFYDVPRCRSAAGSLWECHVIRQLSTGTKRRIELKPLSPPGTPTSDPAFVDLPFSNPRTHGSREQLAKDLADIVPSMSSGSSQLFFPGAKNQVTFDAFSISSDAVNLFQSTISPEKYPKASGSDFLWDALSRAMDLTDPAFRSHIEELKPSQKKKWRLIFVIPHRAADYWTKPQSIDFGGINPKRAWGGYVKQFVMVLDDAGGDGGTGDGETGDGETGFDMQVATTSQGTGRVPKRQVEETMIRSRSGGTATTKER
jgi:hypothetical protein